MQWGWNEGELRVVVQFVRGGYFFLQADLPFCMPFYGGGEGRFVF